MKAMILAAGLGTRLGEITQKIPKCLVTVKGQTLLAHVIEKIKALGISSIVINTHHFADQVEAYLQQHNNFGIDIKLSYEPELLETGGGPYHARAHFVGEHEILIHNADIYHSLNLEELINVHRRLGPIATLLVMQRQTSRYLIFDEQHHLIGRVGAQSKTELARDSTVQNLYAFSGIQIVSPRFFELLDGFPAKFSIIDGYLHAVKQGSSVLAHLVENGEWSDVGTPERLAQLQ